MTNADALRLVQAINRQLVGDVSVNLKDLRAAGQIASAALADAKRAGREQLLPLIESAIDDWSYESDDETPINVVTALMNLGCALLGDTAEDWMNRVETKHAAALESSK